MTAPAAGANVTIAGAGPVGALLGIFLARRGYTVEIFERRADMRAADIPAGRSINLALANRGIDALRRVGLMGAVEPHLTAMRGRMVHEPGRTPRLQRYGQRPDEVIYSVSRATLNGLLLDAAEGAGVSLHFQQRCVSADLAARTVVLHDAVRDERLDRRFEVLIGADGGGSMVREAVLTATDGALSEEPLAHGYKELVIAPAADGSFAMASDALHIWPRGGFMLIALPNTDASFTATLFLPNAGEEGFEALDDDAAVDAFFARHFGDAVPLLRDVAGTFRRNPTGVLGTIRCWPWCHQGVAALIGDAAHAIVPFHGQGMNAGFEDCVEFDRCIERHAPDWERAFARFGERRKPDADAIADMALENYVEMRASVRDPKFLLKKALAFELEARFPDAFVPRYSMVMFRRISYAEALRRGRIQAEILDELAAAVDAVDAVDFARAEALIGARLAARADL